MFNYINMISNLIRKTKIENKFKNKYFLYVGTPE